MISELLARVRLALETPHPGRSILRSALLDVDELPPFACPSCGHAVRVDDDGWVRHCGGWHDPETLVAVHY